MGFRALVGMWTSLMLIFGAIFDACLFVDYITKFTSKQSTFTFVFPKNSSFKQNQTEMSNRKNNFLVECLNLIKIINYFVLKN